MSGVDKFKVGDRVVLARPDQFQTSEGLAARMVGTVIRTDGDGVPKVAFDAGSAFYVGDSQLDCFVSDTPKRRDDRRERIANAVLAGFAADSNTSHLFVRDLAKAAVEWADALIEELDR